MKNIRLFLRALLLRSTVLDKIPDYSVLSWTMHFLLRCARSVFRRFATSAFRTELSIGVRFAARLRAWASSLECWCKDCSYWLWWLATHRELQEYVLNPPRLRVKLISQNKFAENTGFSGDIYANPSRDLFRQLGMTIETLAGTPKGEEKRSYVTGVLANVLKSIWVRNSLYRLR